MKTIYLAGGCFWGTQRFFDQFDGIVNTEVGYANGGKSDPTYEDVCNDSGHAETVRVEYDEEIMSTKELVQYYFMVIDPTTVNRQGGDTGIQYRTGIYYEDDSQLDDVMEVVMQEQSKYEKPIVVEVRPLENYYKAEEYHQKYLDKNPGGYCHINQRLLNLPKEKE